MSCSVCNGHPGCPVCSPAAFTTECQECNGEGYTAYLDQDGGDITREQWEALPESKRDQEECGACEGSGIIEFEYEYDYDE